MGQEHITSTREKLVQYAPVAGGILVISGLLLLLDQRLQTRWLSLSIPAFISLALIFFGIYRKQVWWSVVGLILAGLGTALVLFLAPILDLAITIKLGYSLLAQGVAWALIVVFLALSLKKLSWWALLVSAISFALAYVFTSNRKTLLDFVFFLTLAVGIVVLVWGIARKKISLIIPGAIIATTGAGVYFGWSNPESPGGLQKTGVMLVWFAFGWLLITVISRIIDKRFTWWPLIPGGILLMVGSGLYIGGNPQNALGFLGNTGSIGMILIGVYLLFLKFGMKR
ncbi:MAG TPA: hypothetical protein PKK59_01275 [Anaerolineaceae bacterium]|nr:hypothetical protein [Anaerolineaceae bacterium]